MARPMPAAPPASIFNMPILCVAAEYDADKNCGTTAEAEVTVTAAPALIALAALTEKSMYFVAPFAEVLNSTYTSINLFIAEL